VRSLARRIFRPTEVFAIRRKFDYRSSELSSRGLIAAGTIDVPGRLLYAVDLTGTLVFACEGAMAAIVGQLDVFGVMVLSFATALAGGIIRDVLIGETPT
jgi:Glycine transporter